MASITVPGRSAAAPASSAPRPRLRLTRRGRRLLRVAVVLATLVLACVGFVLGGAVSRAGDGPAGPATTQVVVQPGQTLWSIAASTLPDLDTREAVARIADLNGLDAGALVRPGQPLVLPLSG